MTVKELARRLLRRPAIGSQSDEARLLAAAVKGTRLPHTFCELGFDAHEFNCAGLLEARWSGYLLDGNHDKITAGRTHLSCYGDRLEIRQAFLDRDNVLNTVAGGFPPGGLGVLSIDVDGNDYWLLEQLFPIQPGIIICEYNASFLHQSITIPYDSHHDRHALHPLGFYHGASLVALAKLCDRHRYDLVAVSEGGLNALFRHRDLQPPMRPLDAPIAYRPNRLRGEWHGLTPEQQWDSVKHLPFVSV
jgi:hypothetical protein